MWEVIAKSARDIDLQILLHLRDFKRKRRRTPTIGRKLKVARAAASGLSLRGLAGAMNDVVSAQAIGKYERDEAMPSSRVLLAIARALDVTKVDLLDDHEIALEGVDFRKKTTTTVREEAALRARTISTLKRYLTVEDLLHLLSVEWKRPRSAPHPVTDIRDAEDAARSVREDWGSATNSLKLFPPPQPQR